VFFYRAGNRAAPDIEFVNKYPPSWMKKVGFSQFSSILLMLPLKFIAMNTLHNFLDPTIYLFCRKICEYISYTGTKNRSERKFPCRVKSKIHFFAIWLWKLAYYQENQPALVIEHIKNSYKMFGATLLMPKWKCQCFDRIARGPSNMVKAREQSKTLNYTDPFQIDQITLHEIFSLASKFHLKVTFIFSNIRLTILYINLICNWSYLEYEYMYIFICLSRRILCNMFEKT